MNNIENMQFDSNLPKISVIMSVFNTRIEWLATSIESILTQKFTNFEFIIILDGPNQKCKDLVDNYANKDSRIIVIENKKNIGLTASLNIGLKLARGKYIARMDADDISLPYRFEQQYMYMENNLNTIVVGGLADRFDGINHSFKPNSCLNDVEINKIQLLFFNSGVPHPSAFIRKDFLDKNHITYNEKYKKSQDYGLWVSIATAGGKIDCLNSVLITYRLSTEQISSSCSTEQICCRKMIISDQLNKLIDNISNEDLEIHSALAKGYKYISDINLYENYITKLISANNKKQIYNPKKFKKVILGIWLTNLLLLIKYRDKKIFKSKLLFKSIFSLDYVLDRFNCKNKSQIAFNEYKAGINK